MLGPKAEEVAVEGRDWCMELCNFDEMWDLSRLQLQEFVQLYGSRSSDGMWKSHYHCIMFSAERLYSLHTRNYCSGAFPLQRLRRNCCQNMSARDKKAYISFDLVTSMLIHIHTALLCRIIYFPPRYYKG